jgi:putative two-component system response regulator
MPPLAALDPPAPHPVARLPALPICGPDDHEVARSAHRVRLGHLAEALALRLGLDADSARQLRLAAPLHDIGELDASETSSEPPWPLTADEERHRLRNQPRRGAALLSGSSLPLFALAAEIALHHRERWDGSGYPEGLVGETIPLSGRIVAVVDYFDALTMPRSYRPARVDDRALAMLAEQAGSAFDPHIVVTFLAHATELIALRDDINASRSAAWK